MASNGPARLVVMRIHQRLLRSVLMQSILLGLSQAAVTSASTSDETLGTAVTQGGMMHCICFPAPAFIEVQPVHEP